MSKFREYAPSKKHFLIGVFLVFSARWKANFIGESC